MKDSLDDELSTLHKVTFDAHRRPDVLVDKKNLQTECNNSNSWIKEK